MKKTILVVGCISICFILVSLSYQPIIAEEPIIEPMVDVKSFKSEDCGCSKIYEIDNPPYLICSILWLIIFTLSTFGFLSLSLYEIIHLEIGNILFINIVDIMNNILVYMINIDCIDLSYNYYWID